MPATDLIQFRRDTSTDWATSNPVLSLGEPGVDTTLKKLKIGDGSSTWSALTFADRMDQFVINVKDYGAKGDGVTDDSAAFQAAFNAAVLNITNTFSLNYRAVHTIFIPAGTYIINSGNAMMGNPSTAGAVNGIRYVGAGVEATMIVFAPTSANQSLLFNNNQFLHVTFDDMSFYGSGSNAATASFMNSVSSGFAQNYVFRRVNWWGTFKYGVALSGSNNNSEMSWWACGIHPTMTGGAFLYSPGPGSGSGQDQFVNYGFYACNVEYAGGDFVSLGGGGSVTVVGGSYIHSGSGSAEQVFFKLLNSNHDAGCCRLHVQDIRVEHRHLLSQLIYCEWSRGEILFENVDTETDAWQGSDVSSLVQSEYGKNANSLPRIRYQQCFHIGKQKFHYNVNTYAAARFNIVYDGCEFVDITNAFRHATDFFTFTNDDGNTNKAGVPVVKVQNSHATFDNDQKEVFDTVLNWNFSHAEALTKKVAFIRPAAGGLPTSSTTAVGQLPLNAVITKVTFFKAAGGSSATTSAVYTLKDGNSTTVASASVGVAWNTAWNYTTDNIYHFCPDENTRTLTLSATGITEENDASHCVVEFFG